MTGYFLTPAYTADQEDPDGLSIFSDKPDALPFGISLMLLGFIVVLVVFGIECDQHN